MEKWSTDSTLFLSGAPSRQRISELAQEVVYGSIDPCSRDELLGLLSQEAVRVCTVIFASLFPPHMRQGLDDEARGGDGGSRGNGEDGSDGNADSVSEGRTRDGEDGGTINDVQLTANGDADAD